jgi:hypothetical protein
LHLHSRSAASDDLSSNKNKNNDDDTDNGIDADSDSDSDSDTDRNLEIRQADEGPYVQHIVQTVELIQIVDVDGKPVSLRTVLPPPGTVVVDRVSGETISAISAPGASWTAVQPSASSASSADGSIGASLSIGISLPVDPTVTDSVSSAWSSVPEALITSSAVSDTGIPEGLLPEPSDFVTPSGGSSFNGTSCEWPRTMINLIDLD